jgi:hypothetical protein
MRRACPARCAGCCSAGSRDFMSPRAPTLPPTRSAGRARRPGLRVDGALGYYRLIVLTRPLRPASPQPLFTNRLASSTWVDQRNWPTALSPSSR